jgi:2,5-diamino-6-(ribosylamino)-4(3H)-pyrimidinone 5'-phosphate reductase
MTERPRVVVSVIASADGRVALNTDARLLEDEPGLRWRSLWPEDLAALLERRAADIERRHHPRVALEGSGTFVHDDAGPLEHQRSDRHDRDILLDDFLPGRRDSKWFAVVDGRSRIEWTSKGDGTSRLLVLACATTSLEHLDYLRGEGIPYLVAGTRKVDLDLALRKMRLLLNAHCVVSEAGGGLNGALLRAGLVDEFHVIIIPAIVGGQGTPTTFDGVPLAPTESASTLELVRAESSPAGAVWLHYDVRRSP